MQDPKDLARNVLQILGVCCSPSALTELSNRIKSWQDEAYSTGQHDGLQWTSEPIPMLLTCPGVRHIDGKPVVCGARHIDEGEFATKPHHTHACQVCGHVWRPAKVNTVGVQFLPGYKSEK